MLLSKSPSASQGESFGIKVAELTSHFSRSLEFATIFGYSCHFPNLTEFADSNYLSKNLQWRKVLHPGTSRTFELFRTCGSHFKFLISSKIFVVSGNTPFHIWLSHEGLATLQGNSQILSANPGI